MINDQLPSAPPLAISGKGMNYLEKHPEREPTVKENCKGYVTISRGIPSLSPRAETVSSFPSTLPWQPQLGSPWH